MFGKKKADQGTSEAAGAHGGSESGARGETPIIEASENGPYVVKGLKSLSRSGGEALPTGSETYLCRCGGSKSKPFCDSTHLSKGFSGKPMATQNGKFVDYEGTELVIHDNRTVCAHVGYCVKGAPAVFDKKRQPWIEPDAGDPAEKVKETIARCPSGSLAYTEHGERREAWDREPSITVATHGPYEVRGGIHLRGQVKVPPVVPEHYALCRCGESKRKPYCDGTHREVGFKDE